MPPIRTPLPITANKPLKTERSHEENQERAYIAASRRSDRSLEARVESARRASEIHKKRTGRSLKVTEQDVINEEMYEEEDDDLPWQYRRLTAHLQTNSSDFNRRLAAYLTNHTGMRNALNDALASSYAQDTANGQAQQQQPQQQPQQQSQQQSPVDQPAQSPQQPFWQPNTMPPSMFQQGSAMPSHMMHQRSSSMSQGPYARPLTHPSMNVQRSASLASPLATPILMPGHRPSADSSTSSSSSPTQKHQQHTVNVPSPSLAMPTPKTVDQPSIGLRQTPANTVFPQPFSANPWSPNGQNDLGPFTMSLPNDAQMFLQQQSFDQSTPKYSYHPNAFNRSHAMHPSFDGMSQTLAPGALETNQFDHFSGGNFSSAHSDSLTAPFSPTCNGNESLFNNDPFKTFGDFGMPSAPVTPAENDWTTFIDDSQWA